MLLLLTDIALNTLQPHQGTYANRGGCDSLLISISPISDYVGIICTKTVSTAPIANVVPCSDSCVLRTYTTCVMKPLRTLALCVKSTMLCTKDRRSSCFARKISPSHMFPAICSYPCLRKCCRLLTLRHLQESYLLRTAEKLPTSCC